MKITLLPLLLLVVPLPRAEVELAFAPEEGTVLRRTFLAEASYRLTDMKASIDGETFEPPDGVPEYGMSFSEHIQVRDTLKGVDGGRPTELLRTFEKLSQENTDTFGDEDHESEYSSPLEGRAVRFTWNEEDERYDVEAADDGELETDDLAEDLDLRLVLPGRAVEVGDEWELDPKLYLAFMWPSGLLDFHAEGEEPSDDERGPSRQTIERMEGSGTAELVEVREEDGVELAVIRVTLEVTTGSDSVRPAVEPESDEDMGSPETTVEVEIERELEGTILWDLTHGHARSAELECKASRLHTESFTVTGEREGEEVSFEVEESRLLEGTIHYSAMIERE